MIRLLTFALLSFFLAGCGPTFITKGEAYPKMYDDAPLSILVVPAINNSTAADATEYLSVTIIEPLSFYGYYVAPVEAVQDIFFQDGLIDGSQFVGVPPELYQNKFGVDAVLFITIEEWDTSYYVIGGNVKVRLKYNLLSTSTGEEIWVYQDELKVDTSSDSGNIFVNMIATAVNTAMTDYVPIAKNVNYMALTSIPFGNYHELHGKDRDLQAVNEDKRAQKD